MHLESFYPNRKFGWIGSKKNFKFFKKLKIWASYEVFIDTDILTLRFNLKKKNFPLSEVCLKRLFSLLYITSHNFMNLADI